MRDKLCVIIGGNGQRSLADRACRNGGADGVVVAVIAVVDFEAAVDLQCGCIGAHHILAGKRLGGRDGVHTLQSKSCDHP